MDNRKYLQLMMVILFTMLWIMIEIWEEITWNDSKGH